MRGILFLIFFLKYDVAVLLAIDVIEKLFFNYTVGYVKYFHQRHNDNDQIDKTPKVQELN